MGREGNAERVVGEERQGVPVGLGSGALGGPEGDGLRLQPYGVGVDCHSKSRAPSERPFVSISLHSRSGDASRRLVTQF